MNEFNGMSLEENQVGEEIFLAGGCLWGVQEFVRHLPGVISTEAGRANGTTDCTQTEYDGYAECVRVLFDANQVSVLRLMDYFFEGSIVFLNNAMFISSNFARDILVLKSIPT